MKKIRVNHLLSILSERKCASVRDLSAELHVSVPTIKRYLKQLEAEGHIKRLYGGAEILTGLNHRYNLSIPVSWLKNNISKTSHESRNKICVLGSFNIDLVASVANFPKPGETVLSSMTSLYPGGKGTNQAIAATNAGGVVNFITKMGRDDFGKIGKGFLKNSKINNIITFLDEEARTGTATIYVSNESGQNMIAVSPGANEKITGNEVKKTSPIINSCSIFLTQLEVNIDAIVYAMRIAKESNNTVILNPAPYKSAIVPYLKYVDIITPNETEATLLSGINVVDYESAKKAAAIILGMGPSVVIITMGGDGLLLYKNGDFITVPPIKIIPVDTTGAGDAFNGALATMISQGEDIDKAVIFANIFTGLSVERKSASNLPKYDDVINYIKKQNVLQNSNRSMYE